MYPWSQLDHFLNEEWKFEFASPKVIAKRLALTGAVLAAIGVSSYGVIKALEKRAERFEYVLEDTVETTIDRSAIRLSYNWKTITYMVEGTIWDNRFSIIDSELYFYLQGIELNESIPIDISTYSSIEKDTEGLVLSEEHDAKDTIQFQDIGKEYTLR